MIIRQAVRDDWKKVKKLYIQLLQNDPDAFLDSENEIIGQSDEYWKNKLENKTGAIFIAIVNGRCVGMGSVNTYDDIPGTPVLNKLGVLPEFRNQGVAHKLIDIRELWAKNNGMKKVRLYVFEDRAKIIEFSLKNGYCDTKKRDEVTRKDGKKTNVVVMEKDL